jgi:hypothetical protein
MGMYDDSSLWYRFVADHNPRALWMLLHRSAKLETIIQNGGMYAYRVLLHLI